MRPKRQAEPVQHTKPMEAGPLRSPGPQGNRGSGAQAGVDNAQRKVAPSVARPIAPFSFEEQEERRGTFPSQQQEQNPQPADGSNELQTSELFVHGRMEVGRASCRGKV